MGKFKEFRKALLENKNEVSPKNVYSTDRIRGIAKDRGDNITDMGGYLLVEPDTQPCEYGQFSKKNLCITDPNMSDWSQFTSVMRPRGGRLVFLFKKSEERSKKRLKPNDIMIFHDASNMGMQNHPTDKIVDMMIQRATSVLDIEEDEFKYSREYLTDYVEQLKENNIFWEIYDLNNNLILPDVFTEELKRNGSSLNELLRELG